MADAPAYYRPITILRPMGDGVVARFSCYKDVSTGQYCVASVETFRPPSDAVSEEWSRQQRLKEFCEGGLDQDWFPTLREALDHWPESAIPPVVI